jgi:hypothetical protein
MAADQKLPAFAPGIFRITDLKNLVQKMLLPGAPF